MNHAVVIAGYDDAGGYWIVKNSWGSSWNGDGYFKVGYGECGIETDVYYASLIDQSCTSYTSTDVPKAIPDLGTVTSNLNVGDSFTLVDVNVGPLNISHTWDEDLDVFLISPASTRVELFTDIGGSGDDFVDTIFDDESIYQIVWYEGAEYAPFTWTFSPEGVLADLNGEGSSGQWQLEITDDFGADAGTLNSWELELCGAPDQDGDGIPDASDPDDDNDGWKDDEEVPGGGGAGTGDAIGSDPLDVDSTPEVCDGVDNDGNEGIDEGFPDTNPGGPKDCMDDTLDVDGDGVGNATDPNDDSWWEDGGSWHHDMFPDAHENYLGTDKDAACSTESGPDNDPFDPFVDGTANLFDLMKFIEAPQALGTDVTKGEAYKRRLDLFGPDGEINLFDLMQYLTLPQALGSDCPYNK